MYVCNGTWTAPAWRWMPPITTLSSIPLLSASQNNWHTASCIGTKCCCWNCPLRKDFLEILGWNTCVNIEKHIWVNHMFVESLLLTDILNLLMPPISTDIPICHLLHPHISPLQHLTHSPSFTKWLPRLKHCSPRLHKIWDTLLYNIHAYVFWW